MQRAEIIAKGDVQRVGFRDTVQRIARDLGLSGTVKNQEPYDVAIVAEGEKDALDKFITELKVESGAIKVQVLEVHWREATGEFPYFKILRGDWQEELGERFDVAVVLLHRSIEIGEENLAIGRENLDTGKKMLEKQDVMIERQDETIGEIRGMRSDFHDHMNRRFTRIEGEIAEIKAAIAEMKGDG